MGTQLCSLVLRLVGRPAAVLDENLSCLFGVKDRLLIAASKKVTEGVFVLSRSEKRQVAAHRKGRVRAFTSDGVLSLMRLVGDEMGYERRPDILHAFCQSGEPFCALILAEQLKTRDVVKKQEVVLKGLESGVRDLRGKLLMLRRYGQETRSYLEAIDSDSSDCDVAACSVSPQVYDRLRRGLERLAGNINEHYRVLGPANQINTQDILWKKVLAMSGLKCLSAADGGSVPEVLVNLQRLRKLVRETPESVLGECRWWTFKQNRQFQVAQIGQRVGQC